jgi:hypothetical protein
MCLWGISSPKIYTQQATDAEGLWGKSQSKTKSIGKRRHVPAQRQSDTLFPLLIDGLSYSIQFFNLLEIPPTLGKIICFTHLLFEC